MLIAIDPVVQDADKARVYVYHIIKPYKNKKMSKRQKYVMNRKLPNEKMT